MKRTSWKSLTLTTSVLLSGLSSLAATSNVATSYGLEMTDTSLARSLQHVSSSTSFEPVVAVIDTGVDVHHPALSGNLWQNPGETGLDRNGRDKATNGIDDDGNGFIDDVHGWNFASNKSSVQDLHGHGTHVAGIIHSVSPATNLMILKYYDPKASGSENLANTVRAIEYAIQMKAHIINYSGGGLTRYPAEEAAIRKAQAAGILFVAAAGNEQSDSDVNGFYPADYGLSNIISVTAVDISRRILPSSNYGRTTVDIAAPGKDIVSTLPGGKYGAMTGTSQATAFVSGAAALLMTEQGISSRSPEQWIAQLSLTGSESEFLIGKTKHQTILNNYRALIMKNMDLGAFGTASSNLASKSYHQFPDNLNPGLPDPGAEDLPFVSPPPSTAGELVTAEIKALKNSYASSIKPLSDLDNKTLMSFRGRTTNRLSASDRK